MEDRKYDIAWAAGFFDGEGCISISRTNNDRSFVLTLNVNQTGTDAPLRKLQQIFNAPNNIRTEPTNRSRRGEKYVWVISKQEDVKRILTELLPFLCAKRYEAELALEYLNLGKKNRSLSEAEIQMREFYRLFFKRLHNESWEGLSHA